MSKEKQKASESDVEIVAEEEFRYGWCSFTPSWLQFMNNVVAFTALMTLGNTFSSGTTNGFCGVAQSQIEIRFQLTSQQSSFIGTIYEITTIPVTIIIAYIGSKGVHRPRWSAIGLIFTSLGCFLYALPHFTTSEYKPLGDNVDDNNLCMNRTEDICAQRQALTNPDLFQDSDLSDYLVVFMLARMCLAIGSSPMYQLGVTFMDDCLTKGKFSLYTSIFAAGGIVGPAFGYVLGGYFVSLWTDFPTVNNPDVDASDPRWVGAWWLGFLVTAFGVWFVIIPMSGYACDLPGAKDIRSTKVSEAFGAESDEIPENINKIDFTAKDVPRYLKEILTNWTFVFLALYICCDIAILGGMGLYLPKLVEVQFEMSIAKAAGIVGLLVVPAGVIGTVSGGLLVDKLNLSIVGIMKAEIFMSLFVIAMGGCLLLFCDASEFVGVDTEYPLQAFIASYDEDFNLTASCNAQCSCEDVPYDPICGPDNLQYYSPCHAGCTNFTEQDSGSREFYDCGCLYSNESLDATAVSGICPAPSCNALIPFSIMMFLAMVGLFMSEAMNISAIFRVVPNTHRLFGSMCQSIMLRVFGTVPAPLIFGAAFDASCLLWQDTCGDRGSCFFYDKQQLALYMFAVCICYKGAALIFMILARILYKPPKPEVIDEIEISDKKNLDAELSVGELNKNFEKKLSTESMHKKVVNGNVKKQPVSHEDSKTYLTDSKVSDFFIANAVQNSPIIAGRYMSTAL